MGDLRDEFIAEVLRLNARFVQEFIEAHSLCPYARGARNTGVSAREVLLHTEPDATAAIDLIEKTQARADRPEVLQVIFPRVRADVRGFEQMHRDVREGLRARLGRNADYVQACFHPDYPCNARNAETLVTFFRKSPDPMIQFVLTDVMEGVRNDVYTGTLVIDPSEVLNFDLAAPRPLSTGQRIARDNHATFKSEGVDKLAALLAEIRADRDRSYARFEGADFESR